MIDRSVLEVSERLYIARERCGLTPANVAKRVLEGGRAQTIRDWERGLVTLKWDRVDELATIYEEVGGVSSAWVLSGKGPIMKVADEVVAGVVQQITEGDG